MVYGSFVLMLHSHLPFYRKAGMWPFGEENLYECMAETYIPLANALNELLAEGIKAGITVGITPILAEQLADPYLQQGFIDYINARLKAVRKDVDRYPDETLEHSEHLAYLAKYYEQGYEQTLTDFTQKYNNNLVAAFKQLQDAGAIEITTSGATHGFSPLLGQDASVNAQFKVGVEAYKRLFGRPPKGCWLPECAYRPTRQVIDPETGAMQLRPSTDAFLYENDLQYFFTEYTAIEGGLPSDSRRLFGLYEASEFVPMETAPAKTGLTTFSPYWLKSYPVAVMGRNNRASFQVWSAADGYPGDGLYREFHRKDVNSGMHYWRLTSKQADLGEKQLYDPERAFAQTEFHADHFVYLCRDILKERYTATGEHQLLMVSFDTELYGHWWYEGVTWLKHVIKKLHAMPEVVVESAGTYLDNHPPKQAIELPETTWGQGGHYWVWDNPDTHWMWPLIHEAEERMGGLVNRFKETADPLTTRFLNQAFRELLLLQASDWPFLVTTFQAKDYAVERFNRHLDNFNELAMAVEDGPFDDSIVADLESVDNPFPNVDFRWFQPAHKVAKAPVLVGNT